MNMEAIKSFITLRQALRESGVIGLNLYENEIHVDWKQLIGEPDLQVKYRFDSKWPFEIYTIKDGIKLLCIADENERLEHFPELKAEAKLKMEAAKATAAYLEEDVILDGMSDHHVS
jgi:hypothetical protein